MSDTSMEAPAFSPRAAALALFGDAVEHGYHCEISAPLNDQDPYTVRVWSTRIADDEPEEEDEPCPSA